MVGFFVVGNHGGDDKDEEIYPQMTTWEIGVRG
jgi:hypothetical protein